MAKFRHGKRFFHNERSAYALACKCRSNIFCHFEGLVVPFKARCRIKEGDNLERKHCMERIFFRVIEGGRITLCARLENEQERRFVPSRECKKSATLPKAKGSHNSRKSSRQKITLAPLPLPGRLLPRAKVCSSGISVCGRRLPVARRARGGVTNTVSTELET